MIEIVKQKYVISNRQPDKTQQQIELNINKIRCRKSLKRKQLTRQVKIRRFMCKGRHKKGGGRGSSRDKRRDVDIGK